MFDRERKLPPLRPEHGAVIEIARNGRGFEGSRHHHQPQFRPLRLQPLRQRQGEVAIKVPLMKLVQHHRAYAVKVRIAQQPSCEHTLR